MSYIGCIWEREKTQLLCLLQISFSSNHHAYKMFAYLKRQIRLAFSTIIQKKKVYLKKYYLFLTFANKTYLSSFVNKFSFFIEKIFIISKFDNP